MQRANAGLAYEILWSLKCASSYNGKSDIDFKLYAMKAARMLDQYERYCHPMFKGQVRDIINKLVTVWKKPVTNDERAVDLVLSQVWYQFEGVMGKERKL